MFHTDMHRIAFSRFIVQHAAKPLSVQQFFYFPAPCDGHRIKSGLSRVIRRNEDQLPAAQLLQLFVDSLDAVYNQLHVVPTTVSTVTRSANMFTVHTQRTFPIW